MVFKKSYTTKIVTDNYTGIIFHPEHEQHYSDFLLSKSDIELFEKVLAEKLKQVMADKVSKAPTPAVAEMYQKDFSKVYENYSQKKYVRQYFGVVTDNRKLLHAAFICMRADGTVAIEHWEKNSITVMGGGTCFFNVEFDLEIDQIIDFNVNSPK